MYKFLKLEPVYLKYGRIKGEAGDPAHRGWIEVRNVSFDNQTECAVTKDVDHTSALLYEACVRGDMADAVIDFVRRGGDGVYRRDEMSGTTIDTIQPFLANEKLQERVSLSYKKVDRTYTPGTPPPGGSGWV